MLETGFETVIGRHGLVSNGSLLWKVSVQIVHNTSEKFVEFLPHNPHRLSKKIIQPLLLPTDRRFYPANTPQEPTDLSTPKNEDLTDKTSQFYPQSTPPTITTTIYINRRGTEQ